MTRVLIVDDQPLHRLGFTMLLEQHPDLSVAGEAANGAQAVEMTAELR
ncbi:DNA-binding response regulator, partial [Streptomyces sp. NPDC006355]